MSSFDHLPKQDKVGGKKQAHQYIKLEKWEFHWVSVRFSNYHSLCHKYDLPTWLAISKSSKENNRTAKTYCKFPRSVYVERVISKDYQGCHSHEISAFEDYKLLLKSSSSSSFSGDIFFNFWIQVKILFPLEILRFPTILFSYNLNSFLSARMYKCKHLLTFVTVFQGKKGKTQTIPVCRFEHTSAKAHALFSSLCWGKP